LQGISSLIACARRVLFERGFQTLSMQFAAVAFVLLMCGCLVGVEAVNLWQQRVREIEDARHRVADLARALGRQAEDTFRIADVSLIGAAKRLERDGTGEQALSGLQPILRARVNASSGLTAFVITDESGRCLVAEPGPLPGDCSLAGRSNFEYFRTHDDTGPRLSPPTRGPVSGSWVIALSRRFNHVDGSFAGTVVMNVSIPYFRDYYGTFDIGLNGAILLASSDDDPVLIVRRPYVDSNIGQSLHGAAIFRAIAEQGPVGELELIATSDGVRRLNAYRKLDAFPLVIAVGLAVDDILVDWRANVRFHILLTLGLVAVITILGALLARHIRLARRLERVAQESAAAYQLLAENSSDEIVRFGADGTRLYVSPASRTILGFAPEELLGLHGDTLVHPDDRDAWRTMFQTAIDETAGEGVTASYRVVHKDGRVIWVEAHARLLASGEVVATIRDITRRKAAEDQVAEVAAAFRLLAENSSDVIVRLSASGTRLYVSPACQAMFGYTPKEMIGRSPLDMVHPDDHDLWRRHFAGGGMGFGNDVSAAYRVLRKDGSIVWVEGHWHRLVDDGGFVVSLRDITRRKEMEDQLQDSNRRLQVMAEQDGLTGLANRRHFDAVLDAEARRATRDGTTLSLVMIDVDHFKAFNDRYGHPAGDACLQRIATALNSVPSRPGDLVARYGGEEMAIILPNTPLAGALTIAERTRLLIRSLAIPHEGNTGQIVTVSLGVASIRGNGDGGAKKLLAAADRALYAAKESGRDVAVAAPQHHRVRVAS
jgi:diguanylate cyclase (GGDEF)-like protein/PAS domain S-box-containing protein